MPTHGRQSTDAISSTPFLDGNDGGVCRDNRQDALGNAEVAQRRAGEAGTSSQARGGGEHTVRRGNTLWGIAQQTYGEGRYWRDIMQANPTKVHRGGDLILVGEVLVLPTVQVPVLDEAPIEGEVETITDEPLICEGPPGGEAPAVEPRGLCTEYGNFTIYPDDYAGPLPATLDGSEAIREFQLPMLLSTREMMANMRRNAVVAEVDDLLSYGVFDLAITDGEAVRALGLLAGLPLSQLKRAVGQINTDRLLDNLPSSQRRTPAFTRVVVAMGPARVGPYLRDLLSYGIFDWAVTDGEVREVVAIVGQFPAPDQLRLLQDLGKKFRARFVDNMPSNHGMTNAQMKAFFDMLPDDELDSMQTLMGVRFQFEVGGRDGGEWDAPGLRRAWTILEQLPPDHVQNNDELDSFLRDSAQQGSGYYRASDDSAVVGYGWADDDAKGTPGHGVRDADGSEDRGLDATGSYGWYQGVDAAGNPVTVNLHVGINLFNTVVRHEIGHAVDAQLGVTAAGGYARTAVNAGRWQEYGGESAFIDAIIAEGGGLAQYSSVHADAPVAYEAAMRRAVDKGKDFNAALQDLRDAGDVASDVPDAPEGVTGPVAALHLLDNWHPDKSPWYDAPNRTPVGGRIFQKAYTWGKWVSYESAARMQFGVSSYQWRAPGEWFAEAYACYYSDHDSPEGTPMGTRLRTRDQATAAWFDTDIDRGHSLQVETGQTAATGGTAPGASTGP